MTYKFENIDLSKFVCLKTADSIYYGEIAYIDEKGLLTSVPADPAEAATLKKVRHGLGIQFYGANEEKYDSKYEGHWDRDKRHGLGIYYYPNKAIYNGEFKYNHQEGTGTFTWHNGDFYQGSWKEGRMEGTGKFVQFEGETFEGIFKNNNFIKDGFAMNPFLNKEQIQLLEKKKKEIALQQEIKKKHKSTHFDKVDNYDRLAEQIKRINLSKKIPCIVAASDLAITKEEFFENLSKSTNKRVFEFDLRLAAEYKKNPEEYIKFKKQVKSDLARVLTKNELFCINIDDSVINAEDICDPDIREFYSSDSFPSQIFDLSEIEKPMVNKKILAQTDYRSFPIGENFNFIIWSKFRLNPEHDPKRLIEKFERRFSSILPLSKVDIIMLM